MSKSLCKKIGTRLGVTGLVAVQIRFGGTKGVLAYDPELEAIDNKEDVMILRESMIKYKSTYMDDIEVLDYNKYRAGYLNRQIILLLLTLGIKPHIFKDLQNEYIDSLENVALVDASIYKYLNYEYDGSLANFPSIVDMIRNVINTYVNIKNEPFIKGILATFKQRGLSQLKNKSNVYVEKAVRVIGILNGMCN
jgi:RNA-dependent RNA polymerase